jgi:hypothetical protein
MLWLLFGRGRMALALRQHHEKMERYPAINRNRDSRPNPDKCAGEGGEKFLATDRHSGFGGCQCDEEDDGEKVSIARG